MNQQGVRRNEDVYFTAVDNGPRNAWESIKKGHEDRLTSNSSADINVMFSYLKENFNDTKPEPQIPAEILQGCTQAF